MTIKNEGTGWPTDLITDLSLSDVEGRDGEEFVKTRKDYFFPNNRSVVKIVSMRRLRIR